MEGFVRDLRDRALRLGFQDLRVASAEPSSHGGFYRDWIRRGFHGEMEYLERPGAVSRRLDLRRTMRSIRSVVVVAQDYSQEDPPGVPDDPSRGVIARYARGQDYHGVLKSRLQELLGWIRQELQDSGLAPGVEGLAYVDTGPILERELGRGAGLGWFGRNTMLIHPSRGSFFFLGVLLVDLPLPSDLPFEADRCGTCRACIDACPTGALLGLDPSGAPMMDARRCISYLTIELKGPIPKDLRPTIGNRIFGCDICQEVCPWNVKFARASVEPAYRAGPDTDGPALIELMGLTEEEFATRFSGSPIKRAKRRGLLRNVAVALGNWLASREDRLQEGVEALCAALDDHEPLVRGHAAWALGRILTRVGSGGDGGIQSGETLLARLTVETDLWVRSELEDALPI